MHSSTSYKERLARLEREAETSLTDQIVAVIERAIADPFRPTAHLVALLRDHAGHGTARPRRRVLRRPLRALGHAGPRVA